MLASALGARVIAVDIAEGRLAIARRLGAQGVVKAATESVPDAVRELTRGHGAELVLETSGSSAVAAQVLDMLTP
jgi:threonine dehydrogenase-like Zn-dependent dehydrogenase